MKLISRFVLTAAVAVSAAIAPVQAADVDKLLPAETEQVVHINVKQVLESDLIKKYALKQIEQALKGNEAQKALQELGMDPLKDIDTIDGGLWGKSPEDMKGVFTVKGKFDLEKLMTAAKKQAEKDGDKVAIVKEGSYTLIKVTMDNRPDPIYMTGLNDKTILVATDKPLAIAALKISDDTTAKPVIKKELATLVGKMDSKASMFFCGISDGKVGDIPPNPLFDNPEKLKKQLEKMESTAFVMKVTGDVTLEVSMGMKDGDAADDFGSTVDELLNKAKAFLPFLTMQNANLKPVVGDLSKSLKSTVKDKMITIVAKVSGDSISKAVGSDD
ncbi:MAG: hypothetical protein ACRCZF_26890 [Gemmataceae bacterium]